MNSKFFYRIIILYSILNGNNLSAGWYGSLMAVVDYVLGREDSKLAEKQLEVNNRLLQTLANNPGVSECADKIGDLVNATKETNLILGEGTDKLTEFFRPLEVAVHVFAGFKVLEMSDHASIGARQWLLPTDQEKKAHETAKSDQENLLAASKARNEFNRCILQNRAEVSRVNGMPDVCRETQAMYLLLSGKKIKKAS